MITNFSGVWSISLFSFSFGLLFYATSTFLVIRNMLGDFPGGAVVKNSPPSAGTRVRSLVWEDPACRRATKPVHHSY